jgi:hypothetical protein
MAPQRVNLSFVLCFMGKHSVKYVFSINAKVSIFACPITSLTFFLGVIPILSSDEIQTVSKTFGHSLEFFAHGFRLCD